MTSFNIIYKLGTYVASSILCAVFDLKMDTTRQPTVSLLQIEEPGAAPIRETKPYNYEKIIYRFIIFVVFLAVICSILFVNFHYISNLKEGNLIMPHNMVKRATDNEPKSMQRLEKILDSTCNIDSQSEECQNQLLQIQKEQMEMLDAFEKLKNTEMNNRTNPNVEGKKEMRQSREEGRLNLPVTSETMKAASQVFHSDSPSAPNIPPNCFQYSAPPIVSAPVPYPVMMMNVYPQNQPINSYSIPMQHFQPNSPSPRYQNNMGYWPTPNNGPPIICYPNPQYVNPNPQFINPGPTFGSLNTQFLNPGQEFRSLDIEEDSDKSAESKLSERNTEKYEQDDEEPMSTHYHNTSEYAAKSYGHTKSSSLRETTINCMKDEKACLSGECVQKLKWCDGMVDCKDASDETGCPCKSRIDPSRICDGFFDCPFGEEELGCFNCGPLSFSCNEWSRTTKKSKCFQLDQRCDGIKDCTNGIDERECTMLHRTLDHHAVFEIAHSKGFLHRNYKGKWYPVCGMPFQWAMDACAIENRNIESPPNLKLLPKPANFNGKFLLAEGDAGKTEVRFFSDCYNGSALFVTCPEPKCGVKNEVSQILRKTLDDDLFDRLLRHKRFDQYAIEIKEEPLEPIFYELNDEYLRDNFQNLQFFPLEIPVEQYEIPVEPYEIPLQIYEMPPYMHPVQAQHDYIPTMIENNQPDFESYNNREYYYVTPSNPHVYYDPAREASSVHFPNIIQYEETKAETTHNNIPNIPIYREAVTESTITSDHPISSTSSPMTAAITEKMFSTTTNEYTTSPTTEAPKMETNSSDPIVGVVDNNMRIVGGKMSAPAAWPWLIGLFRDGLFSCGGSIINEKWVLTAAHCTTEFWRHYYEVSAGMLRRFSFSPQEQVSSVELIIPHQGYDRQTMHNDLSLLKLKHPLAINRWARPVCLPNEDSAGPNWLWGPPTGIMCMVIGWGASVESGANPDHLREVEVPIIANCKTQDDREGNEICAGFEEGGKDACQGDSGGPYLCRNPHNNQQWFIAGIVSHGEGCARPGLPGVYTRVSLYTNWINEMTATEHFPIKKPKQVCPGFTCKWGVQRCIPKVRVCDKIVDCLGGEDEYNCNQEDNKVRSREDDNRDDEFEILFPKPNTEEKKDSITTKITETEQFNPFDELKKEDQAGEVIDVDENITDGKLIHLTEDVVGDTVESSGDGSEEPSVSEIKSTTPGLVNLKNTTTSKTRLSSTETTFLINETSTESNFFNNDISTEDDKPPDQSFTNFNDLEMEESKNINVITEQPPQSFFDSPSTIESNEDITEPATMANDLPEEDNTEKFDKIDESTFSSDLQIDDDEFENKQLEISTTLPNNLLDQITESFEEESTESLEEEHTKSFEEEHTELFEEEHTESFEDEHTESFEEEHTESSTILNDEDFNKHKADILELSSSDSDFTTTESIPINEVSVNDIIKSKNNIFRHEPKNFQCSRFNQTFVKEKRCDSVVDCEDGSDERDCTCREKLYAHWSTGFCDNFVDCPDRSDEYDCDFCPDGYFYCGMSKQCVRLNKVCDRKRDCDYGEDELECFALLPKGSLLTNNFKPQLQPEGEIIMFRDGKWELICENDWDDDKMASTAVHICNYLGFGKTQFYSAISNSADDENEINVCKKLLVKCDFSSNPNFLNLVKNQSVVTYNQQLLNIYQLDLMPWIAKLYHNGKFKCTGVLIDHSWVLIENECRAALTLTSGNIVAVVGNKRTIPGVNSPSQQHSIVDLIIPINDFPTTMLHLKNSLKSTKYVRPVKLPPTDVNRFMNNEVCTISSVNEEGIPANIHLIPEIENCDSYGRCFVKLTHNDCQENNSEVDTCKWSGIVVCYYSDYGWYAAAAYKEPLGSCGFNGLLSYPDIYHRKDKLMININRYIDSNELIKPAECIGVRCPLGECIPLKNVCDGINDCDNGVDEDAENCQSKKNYCFSNTHHPECGCTRFELMCKNGQCVDKGMFGNKIAECHDKSDENHYKDPSKCFTYLQMTQPKFICDGISHCEDRSDEDSQVCGCARPYEVFSCPNDGYQKEKCIPTDAICDKRMDCPGGEDEIDCNTLRPIDNRYNGVGEIIERQHGFWQPECFERRNYSRSELEAICESLGYTNGHAVLINSTLVQNYDAAPLTYIDVDHFSKVTINNITFGVRNKDKPYAVKLPIKDQACNRLFIECV